MPIFRPRKFTFFPFLILFKRIESIDMTPCVISFLVKNVGQPDGRTAREPKMTEVSVYY